MTPGLSAPEDTRRSKGAFYCPEVSVDLLPKDFLSQFPYIAVMIGLFYWFWKAVKDERQKCDERAEKRDERFTEVIERNTRAIADLDRTVANARFVTQNDRRAV